MDTRTAASIHTRPLSATEGRLHRLLDEPNAAGAGFHARIVGLDRIRTAAGQVSVDVGCDAEINVGESFVKSLGVPGRQARRAQTSRDNDPAKERNAGSMRSDGATAERPQLPGANAADVLHVNGRQF